MTESMSWDALPKEVGAIRKPGWQPDDSGDLWQQERDFGDGVIDVASVLCLNIEKQDEVGRRVVWLTSKPRPHHRWHAGAAESARIKFRSHSESERRSVQA